MEAWSPPGSGQWTPLRSSQAPPWWSVSESTDQDANPGPAPVAAARVCCGATACSLSLVPTATGPAESLFKESYYQLMKTALKDNGVLCCQGEWAGGP